MPQSNELPAGLIYRDSQNQIKPFKDWQQLGETGVLNTLV